jgi:hypothetical protein
MPLGDYALGTAPVGWDLPGPPPPPRNVTPPPALFFDPAIRDVQVLPNGQYRGQHPVDHTVTIRLFMVLGKIPVAPDTGSTVRSLPIDTDQRMTADADARVRTVLADLIANGDVQLVSVVASAGTTGFARVRVTWINLRLPKGQQPQQSTTVNFNQ